MPIVSDLCTRDARSVKINGYDGGGVYSSPASTRRLCYVVYSTLAVLSHSISHCKIGLIESPYLNSTERLFM